jgi:hypothetical protein
LIGFFVQVSVASLVPNPVLGAGFRHYAIGAFALLGIFTFGVFFSRGLSGIVAVLGYLAAAFIAPMSAICALGQMSAAWKGDYDGFDDR